MSTELPLLAIDGGQSSTRFRIGDATGVLPPVRTGEPLEQQISGAIRTALSQRPQAGPIRVAAGYSGLLPEAIDPARILEECAGLGVRSVHLAHDSISGYLSCLGEQPGACVAVGTGVVALSTGPTGFARIDGWGHLLGDAGSGYWIGRRGLEAAMRAHDGRGQDTRLLAELQADFPDVESAYIQIQSMEQRVAFVASYARKVIELADHDAVARRIVEQACDELVHSLDTGLRRVGWAPGCAPAISWVGNIATNQMVDGLLRGKMLQQWPQARILPAGGTPLDGVALLPGLPGEHPLSSQVLHAQRSASAMR
ncbi:hypothetical protein AOZ07_17545 [Glutamicibacter halophytocola]|uniref:N-acetylglucosamine kinase n=1 Tax=Glutamicibacter halophytocola TaxID=1933880 RepID=UPI0006D4B815|nr:BadF/BadG/BcrA/BcrD ATPase family protein [Glutamicibacter halophytocola]ALG30605.1 hypothetical protein AOZ07_17545 [Glutamicibacter halophytocola]